MPKGKDIAEMFSSIAPKYDLANHILSLGLDYYWRYTLARLVKEENPLFVADLATGSGDVLFAIYKKIRHPKAVFYGFDFSYPMLEQAKQKQKKYFAKANNIFFEFGDCLNLPLKENSVNIVTIAFGYRNLESRPKALHEIYRILKNKGKLFILEFSQPYKILKPVYKLYLNFILPSIAKCITCQKSAYKYLSSSIEAFPDKHNLQKEILTESPFKESVYQPLSGGIVCIHTATKIL